jgi:hypothetical protein
MIDVGAVTATRPVSVCRNWPYPRLPSRMGSHPTSPISAGPARKHRTKAMLPAPDCLMADFAPTFVPRALDLPQRKRKTNGEHYGDAHVLGAGFV